MALIKSQLICNIISVMAFLIVKLKLQEKKTNQLLKIMKVIESYWHILCIRMFSCFICANNVKNTDLYLFSMYSHISDCFCFVSELLRNGAIPQRRTKNADVQEIRNGRPVGCV